MSCNRVFALALVAVLVVGCAATSGPSRSRADRGAEATTEQATADRATADRATADQAPSDRAGCGAEPPCDRTRRPARAASASTEADVAQAVEQSRAGQSRAGPTRARTSAQGGGRRFWVDDKRRYRSPWYAGAHRRMINFGCTPAPYYSPDPRCPRRRGFHHGLDIAMACGTRLFAGLRGRVVNPSSPGSLGSAYGANAFRIRNHNFRVDIVIGHTRKVFVSPGDRVRRGQLIARASDMGAPDGCHLHFEVRPRRGSVSQAVNPRPRLQLRAVE